MEYRRFGDTYVLRVDRGEEVVGKLLEMCSSEGIKLASVTGLGAADRVVMGLYNVSEQKYHQTILEGGEYEITSIVGSISEKDGKPYHHLHINAAGEDGITHGGHLNEVRISATCELIVRCIEGHVGRMQDSVTGLNIYCFDRE